MRLVVSILLITLCMCQIQAQDSDSAVSLQRTVHINVFFNNKFINFQIATRISHRLSGQSIYERWQTISICFWFISLLSYYARAMAAKVSHDESGRFECHFYLCWMVNAQSKARHLRMEWYGWSRTFYSIGCWRRLTSYSTRWPIHLFRTGYGNWSRQTDGEKTYLFELELTFFDILGWFPLLAFNKISKH